uniref:Uncharacterized protein n=1 Tax=Hyaloperonospora arabidopsidis (strain Emoy2) TaxID=559515 RepID=M4BCJ3_HYAAE
MHELMMAHLRNDRVQRRADDQRWEVNTYVGMQKDEMSGCATRHRGKIGEEETRMRGKNEEEGMRKKERKTASCR